MTRALTFELRRRPRYWLDGKPKQVELQFVPWEAKHTELLTHYKSGLGSRPYSERALCFNTSGSSKLKRTTLIDRVTCPRCVWMLAQQQAWEARRQRRKARRERIQDAADRLAGRLEE